MAIFLGAFYGLDKSASSKEALNRLQKLSGRWRTSGLTVDQRRKLFLCKMVNCTPLGDSLRQRPSFWPLCSGGDFALGEEDFIVAVEEAGEEQFLVESLPMLPSKVAARLMELMGQRADPPPSANEGSNVLGKVARAIAATLTCQLVRPEEEEEKQDIWSLQESAYKIIVVALEALDAAEASVVSPGKNLACRLLMLKTALACPDREKCLRMFSSDWKVLAKTYYDCDKFEEAFDSIGEGRIPSVPLCLIAAGCLKRVVEGASVSVWMDMLEEGTEGIDDSLLNFWPSSLRAQDCRIPSNMQWLVGHFAYECVERMKILFKKDKNIKKALLFGNPEDKDRFGDVSQTLKTLADHLEHFSSRYDRRLELYMDEKSPNQLLKVAAEPRRAEWERAAIAEHLTGKKMLTESLSRVEILKFLTMHCGQLTDYVRLIYRAVLVLPLDIANVQGANQLFFGVFRSCQMDECLALSKLHLEENGTSTKLKTSSFEADLRLYLNKTTGERDESSSDGVDFRFLMGLVLMDPVEVLRTLLGEGMHSEKKNKLLCGVLSKLGYLVRLQVPRSDGGSEFLVTREIMRFFDEASDNDKSLSNLAELAEVAASANGGLAAVHIAKNLLRRVLDQERPLRAQNVICGVLGRARRTDVDRWTALACCELLQRWQGRRARERLLETIKSFCRPPDLPDEVTGQPLRDTVAALLPEVAVWARRKESDKVQEGVSLLDVLSCDRRTTRLVGSTTHAPGAAAGTHLAAQLAVVWERLLPEQWRALMALDFPGFAAPREKARGLLNALELQLLSAQSPLAGESVRMFTSSLLRMVEDSPDVGTESCLAILQAASAALETSSSSSSFPSSQSVDPLSELCHGLAGVALSRRVEGRSDNPEERRAFVGKLLAVVHSYPNDVQARELSLAKIKSLIINNIDKNT